VNTPDFFDMEAAEWSERYAHDPRFRRRFEKITGLLDRMIPEIPGRALDAGCGTGIFSQYLVRRGWKVTAIDVSPDMIESARGYESERGIDFRNSSLETFDEIPNTFNVILSLSSLEYIEDDESAIQKFHQLLTPGGLLVVSVPNKAGILRKMEGVVFGIRTITRDRLFGGRGEYLKFQKRQYTPFELDILMRQFGLKKKRGIFLSGGITRPNWLLPIVERRWWAAMYCAVYEKK
jgi:2-polyprenyl-6-hydroxyphenyl methylase/3-demethylubiquinone-9 3-methyltransferase